MGERHLVKKSHKEWNTHDIDIKIGGADSYYVFTGNISLFA